MSPTSRQSQGQAMQGVTSMFGYNSDGPTPRFSTPSSDYGYNYASDSNVNVNGNGHGHGYGHGHGHGHGHHTPATSHHTQHDNRQKICAPSPSDLDDAEDGGSLTRQLAETATGVREMSKQLGRTKVKSNIQSVLIVTKARDNRLIRLTREVAVYLMKMKSRGGGGGGGERGMIV
jgi:hypothetical protein